MFRVLKVFLCAFASIFLYANLFSKICEDEISKIKLASSAPIEELLPLEQSIYYQGVNLKLYPSSFNEHGIAPVLVFNSELIGTHKIRDENKAFEMAKIALEKEEHFNEWERANLATCYISGIGVEKDYDKARDLVLASCFSTQMLYNSSLDKLKKKEFGNDTYDLSLFFAYLYYKGYGVEKNDDKCIFIIKNIKDTLTWRNFYIGKFAPYDREFAIHILKNFPSKIYGAYILNKIYSGLLNPEDKNLSKATYWANAYELAKKEKDAEFKAKWNEEVAKLKAKANTKTEEGGKFTRMLAFMYLKKEVNLGVYFDEIIAIPNQNYNTDIAEKLLIEGGLYGYRFYYIMILKLIQDGGSDEAEIYLNRAIASKDITAEQKNNLNALTKKLKKENAQMNLLLIQMGVDNF